MSWGDVFISVCVLGVLANSLALLVWCGEKAYNATTFLFKYLAVCDNVYLAVFGAFVACVQRKVNANPIVFVANAAQLLSAHTTLLVAITRWLAVFKPLHARVLLDPRRVIAACVALLVWCLLLESVHVVMEYGRVELSESIEMTAIYSKMVVGLVLPLLLLLGFNVALVWTAYRRR
nr:hypothetical protein BaRGS_008260 [Batillaria attramentaria]